MISVDERQVKVFERLEMLASTDAKKYVRMPEAQRLFSMGSTKLRELAEEAGAVRKIDSMVLINVQVLYDYIEHMYS